MNQHEAVYEVMKKNNGYATLAQLYKDALEIPGCKWGTKTPFASIRRIVQGYPALFFRIRPGLWGLVEQQGKILTELSVQLAPVETKLDEYGHSYYQGLAVELGNFRGFKTYIPKQDKNKKYIGGILGESTTGLEKMPDFSYAHLVKCASNIDTVWFNERNIPNAFFEIEHTTDIINSLVKFVDFQDFRAKCYIVADGARRREFDEKINRMAFSNICENVKFIDYETLANLHAKESELVLLKSKYGL